MQIGSKSCLEGKPVCPAAPYKEFLVAICARSTDPKKPSKVFLLFFSFLVGTSVF